MGYFEIGLNLGLFVFAIYVGALTFNKTFREYFYGTLMEDSYLGDMGQYLFFPTEYDIENDSVGKRVLEILGLIAINFGIFALVLMVFTVLGAILLIPILLALIIGPFVYININKKRKQIELEKEKASLADDEQQ